MLIRLTIVPGATEVEIDTMDGVLRGPEHLIEIVDMVSASVMSAPVVATR